MLKDERLDIRIPSALKHRLALEAARDNRSMAGVVITAVTKYLDHPNNETEGKKK